jgi:thiol:disulfide interchange protein DsbD
MSGVFQIGMSLVGVGQGLTRHSGQLGSFFTGLLAVVVATPCTAPFMVVAIAAGLAAPPAVTMMVFLAMGLGMAMPYVLLAFVPVIGSTAPKPGRWMEVLRQALAFPMYAASAADLVVSLQAGPAGVLGTAPACAGLAARGWHHARSVAGRRIGRRRRRAFCSTSRLMASRPRRRHDAWGLGRAVQRRSVGRLAARENRFSST